MGWTVCGNCRRKDKEDQQKETSLKNKETLFFKINTVSVRCEVMSKGLVSKNRVPE